MPDNEITTELRIQQLEEASKQNKEAHRDFYGRFENINLQLVRYQADVSHIGTTLSEISIDVKELKEKPVKRYDTIINCILTAIVGGIVGFLLNGLL